MNRKICIALIMIFSMVFNCYGEELQEADRISVEKADIEEDTLINDIENDMSYEVSENDADILQISENEISANEANSSNEVGKKSGSFGKNAKWSYDNGLVTIKGTGVLEPDSKTESQFGELASSVRYLCVEPGITAIGADAFINLTSLKYCYIPDSVEKIEANDCTESIFWGCREYITIFVNRSSLSGYGKYWRYTNKNGEGYAFYGAGVTKEKYFDYWANFKADGDIVDIDCQYIPIYAFEDVKGFKYIYLTNNVKYIKGSPFSYMEQKPVVMSQRLSDAQNWSLKWNNGCYNYFYGVEIKKRLDAEYAHDYHKVGETIVSSDLEVARKTDYVDKNDVIIKNKSTEVLNYGEYKIDNTEIVSGVNTIIVTDSLDESVHGQFQVLGTDGEPFKIMKGIKAEFYVQPRAGVVVDNADLKVWPIYDMFYVADKKACICDVEGDMLNPSQYSIINKVISSATKYVTVIYSCDQGVFSQRLYVANDEGTKLITVKNSAPKKQSEDRGYYGAEDGFSFTIAKDEYTYTGRAVRPKVKGTYFEYTEVDHELETEEDYYNWSTYKTKKVVLKENIDFDVEYINNINPGVGAVQITGLGGYSGRVEIPFTISLKDNNNKIIVNADSDGFVNINEAQVELKDAKPLVYNGKAVMPKMKVTCDGIELKEKKDYKVIFANNINAGKAIAYIIGQGRYSGVKQFVFEILKSNFDNIKIKLPTAVEYPRSIEDVLPVIKDASGFLKVNKDYILEYESLENIVLSENGVPFKVKIKSIEGSNYNADVEKEVTLNIVKRDIGNKKRANIFLEDYYWDMIPGYEYAAEPSVYAFYDEIKLVEDKDYTITYANNARIGTAKVIVSGMGMYSGKVVLSFKIHRLKEDD